VEIRYQLYDKENRGFGKANQGVPLPSLLPPGQSAVAVVPVAVPAEPGAYRINFVARLLQEKEGEAADENGAIGYDSPTKQLELVVMNDAVADRSNPGEAFVTAAQAILAEAHALKTLPAGYHDVTQGLLASWKQRIKQKLLNNFRRAYVDVLSRQQSLFNERLLTALAQVTDCCSALGHAVLQDAQGREVARLRRRLRKSRAEHQRLRKRLTVLENRLARLEQATQVS
jgi:hypothetical protein